MEFTYQCKVWTGTWQDASLPPCRPFLREESTWSLRTPEGWVSVGAGGGPYMYRSIISHVIWTMPISCLIVSRNIISSGMSYHNFAPCPNYTVPLNPCDRNCCQRTPSPHIPWCCRAPSTRELWGCGMLNLLVLPWAHPLILSSMGGPVVSPNPLDEPPTHPDTHPAGKISLSGWMAVWVGEGGYGGGGGGSPTPRSIFPTNSY